MKRSALIASALLMIVVPVVQAQQSNSDLRLCNGVWTDRSCDQVEESFGGTISRSASSSASASSQRARFLFNEFDLARLNANRRYNINMDVGSARDLCLGENVVIDDCRQELDKQRVRLDTLVMHAQSLEANRDRAEAERIASQSDQQVVVIDNSTSEVWGVGGWDGHRKRGGYSGRIDVGSANGSIKGGVKTGTLPVMPPPSPPEPANPPSPSQGGRGKVMSVPSEIR